MLLLIKTYHFTNHRRRHIYLAHSEIESFIQNELRLGLGWKKQSLFCSSIHKYYVETTHQITGLSFDRLIRQIITIFVDTSNSKRSHPCALSAPDDMPCHANSFSASHLSNRDISEFWWCYSDSGTSHCRIQSFSHSLNDENVKWRSVRMIR